MRTIKLNTTKGEWARCLGAYGPYIKAESPGKDIVIAKLHYSMTPEVSEEESVANCRLMASAPKLLEALEAMLLCGTGGKQAVEARILAGKAIQSAVAT